MPPFCIPLYKVVSYHPNFGIKQINSFPSAEFVLRTRHDLRNKQRLCDIYDAIRTTAKMVVSYDYFWVTCKSVWIDILNKPSFRSLKNRQ